VCEGQTPYNHSKGDLKRSTNAASIVCKSHQVRGSFSHCLPSLENLPCGVGLRARCICSSIVGGRFLKLHTLNILIYYSTTLQFDLDEPVTMRDIAARSQCIVLVSPTFRFFRNPATAQQSCFQIYILLETAGKISKQSTRMLTTCPKPLPSTIVQTIFQSSYPSCTLCRRIRSLRTEQKTT
jgi:hypothetical protein